MGCHAPTTAPSRGGRVLETLVTRCITVDLFVLDDCLPVAALTAVLVAGVGCVPTRPNLIDRRSYFAGRLEEGGTADLSVQDLFHDVVLVLLPGLAGLDQAMGLGPGGLGVT